MRTSTPLGKREATSSGFTEGTTIHFCPLCKEKSRFILYMLEEKAVIKKDSRIQTVVLFFIFTKRVKSELFKKTVVVFFTDAVL